MCMKYRINTTIHLFHMERALLELVQKVGPINKLTQLFFRWGGWGFQNTNFLSMKLGEVEIEQEKIVFYPPKTNIAIA